MNNILDTNEENSSEEIKHNLNPFQIIKGIEEGVDEYIETDITKESIFELLKSKYGKKYEKLIAKTISSTIRKEEKEKYRKYQNVLLILLILSMIGSIYTFFYYYQYITPNKLIILFLFFEFFIEYILIRGIVKFRGNILFSIMIIKALKIISVANDLNKGYYSEFIYLVLTTWFFTFILALIMKNKIFPKLRYSGPKKSKFGNYIFDE